MKEEIKDSGAAEKEKPTQHVTMYAVRPKVSVRQSLLCGVCGDLRRICLSYGDGSGSKDIGSNDKE